MEWHGYSAVQNALNDYLEHHGVKGQKWGVRRYQNKDGSRTKAGKEQARTNNRVSRLSSTNKDVNAIYKSLPDSQKSLLGMSDSEIKSKRDWIYNKEQNKNIAKRFIAKDSKGNAASFLEIWDDGNPKLGQIAIATRKDLQGKGYSKQVVEKAINWFNSPKNRSMGELQWNAFERNKASMTLAKKYGFVETDRLSWEDYPGDDYVFMTMKKQINKALS